MEVGSCAMDKSARTPFAGFNASTGCKSSRSRRSPNCWLAPIAGNPHGANRILPLYPEARGGLAALSRGRATRLGRFEAAAALLLAATTSAGAVDPGDCCADLAARIAELEATT